MKLSKKLKIFIALSTKYSALMVPLLQMMWGDDWSASQGYQVGPGSSDVPIIIIYGFLIVLTGFLLSKTDKNRTSRSNVPLIYHFYGAIVVSTCAVLGWILLTYFGWRYVMWLITLSWGSYAVHWVLKRNQSKGINKKEAFK